MNPFKQIVDWEQRVRSYYNTDLSTPENRRRANIYNLWFDHAVLRKVWTNFHEIAPDVYRSNQPTHERFVRLKEKGIKTVLNLRGRSRAAHYLVEEESCRDLGLELVSVPLKARRAAPRDKIQDVIQAFREIDKPFVMHCKSGADRAGFASAVYLMTIRGAPVSEARRMLSLRYIHIRQSRTGVLDHILDLYEARAAERQLSFEDWIADEYDHATVQANYEATYKPLF